MNDELIRLLDPAEWMQRANCRGLDPNLFFPDRGDQASIANAKAVCLRCEVRAECLQYAIDTNQDLGVWGGVTRNELQVARQTQRVLRARAIA